jgi:hypothetical protein
MSETFSEVATLDGTGEFTKSDFMYETFEFEQSSSHTEGSEFRSTDVFELSASFSPSQDFEMSELLNETRPITGSNFFEGLSPATVAAVSAGVTGVAVGGTATLAGARKCFKPKLDIDAPSDHFQQNVDVDDKPGKKSGRRRRKREEEESSSEDEESESELEAIADVEPDDPDDLLGNELAAARLEVAAAAVAIVDDWEAKVSGMAQEENFEFEERDED